MNADSDQPQPERRCAWCSAPARDEETNCSACGASLAQRETIGDLVIPGVTHVDPALKAYADQPLRIPGPSPSQYVAGPAVGTAVVMGGPAGLLALAGLGAVAAAEYAGANRGQLTPEEIARLGQPSEVVLQMVRKLDEKWEQKPQAATAEGAETSQPADTTETQRATRGDNLQSP